MQSEVGIWLNHRVGIVGREDGSLILRKYVVVVIVVVVGSLGKDTDLILLRNSLAFILSKSRALILRK